MECEKLRKKLFEYGIWYTSRYPVSHAHFAVKLERRLKNILYTQVESKSELELESESEIFTPTSQEISDHISAILTEISPYYDELSCARSIIFAAIQIKKPPVKVLASLRIKGYTKSTLMHIQDEFTEYFNDFDSLRPRIEKKILSLLQKGYGEKYILPYLEQEFGWKQHFFCPLLSHINTTTYLQEYVGKKSLTLDKSDLFKHLYQKGHSTNTIREILESI